MKENDHNCLDLEQTKLHVEKFGLSVIMVEATNYLPSFAYSVGLQETLNHPEIICFGLSTSNMHGLINDVVEIIKKEGAVVPAKEYLNIFAENRAEFIAIDSRNISDYFGVALAYYESAEIDGLQLVWTDRNNKFPWEVGFEEEFRIRQPLLDRNADFKFREAKNLGVFTTSQFVENNEPILRVIHEEDGDWQFLTKEIDFENGKVVALEQMVLRDNTLNQIFNLDYGEEAERNYVGGEWKRKMFKNEGEYS